jgi:arylsulfatase A-like enzyme
MKYFFLLSLITVLAHNSTATPNLIVIMADDLGYADVGFNGSQDIPTPHIDRIASEGVKCTSAYTSYSVCGPSRAGFLTGRYQQRFGFERNPLWLPKSTTTGLSLQEKTIAESLNQVGSTVASLANGTWEPTKLSIP